MDPESAAGSEIEFNLGKTHKNKWNVEKEES